MDLSLANLVSFSALNTPLIIVVTQSSFLPVSGKGEGLCLLAELLSFLSLWAALGPLLEHLHVPVLL